MLTCSFCTLFLLYKLPTGKIKAKANSNYQTPASNSFLVKTIGVYKQSDVAIKLISQPEEDRELAEFL
ncbi:hypothetical protein ACJIZ3_019409 [Penstemon smallii]|uniref:Uncharacterized protein n=1 Tax=Penstemon smallii TaxID=265156 RepID=A0ABD3T177_9LAMI